MAKAKKDTSTINVTLVRSVIGRIESHKATVKGLGLRRLHHTVQVQDTPASHVLVVFIKLVLKVVKCLSNVVYPNVVLNQ